jgi:thiol-disulfide isomerase/thioredoxin
MMDKKSYWKGFIVGAITFLCLAFYMFNKFAVQSDVSLNQNKVQTLEEKHVDLNNYLGKPLVINYWATWCKPCVKEFPYFNEANNTFKNKVNFIMISDENINEIIKFKKSKEYTLNYLHSQINLSELGINALPTTYFYNSAGVLVNKHTGSIDSEKLYELISKIK